MRLFVAIELSADMRRAMRKVQRSLAEFDRSVRWTGEEQMHLTLKFLGEVADADVGRVTSALAQAASVSEPFRLATKPAGCFPPRGKVRIVWAGLAADGGALQHCWQAVEDALGEEGFAKEERPFSPHLTLGRVREGRAEDRLRERTAAVAVPAIDQPVDAISLMQSELDPSGARHTRVAAFRLGG